MPSSLDTAAIQSSSEVMAGNPAPSVRLGPDRRGGRRRTIADRRPRAGLPGRRPGRRAAPAGGGGGGGGGGGAGGGRRRPGAGPRAPADAARATRGRPPTRTLALSIPARRRPAPPVRRMASKGGGLARTSARARRRAG